MFYYLYEIRNNINGKIYVGVHKTQDLNDGYMGSGKVINRSIEKYGIDNFTKTILEHFDSAEAMYAREKEVVNEEFLERDDTYNLRRGGHGGFDYINKTGKNVDLTEQRKRDPSISHRSIATQKERRIGFYSPEVRAKGRKKCLDLKLGYMNPEVGARGRAAAQSESARIKRVSTMAENGHQRGEKNSQYGSRWICNIISFENKKIAKEDPIPEGWICGRNKWISPKPKITKISLLTKKYKNGMKVSVDDIEYDSISQAADILGLGHETARMRFKSISFSNYRIL